jgi:hypothetical protein
MAACGTSSTDSVSDIDSGVVPGQAADTGAGVSSVQPGNPNNPSPPPSQQAGSPAPPQPTTTGAQTDAATTFEDAALASGIDASANAPSPQGQSAPSPSADASPALVDASTPADASEPPTSAFTCTLLIGIQATEEWYTAGFETMVDNSRWELIWVHSGFVELWANANDPVWSTAITSPCAQNPDKPDRVIFVALNFLMDTSTFWTPTVASAVANIEAKYPSAKRIELMSFIRAPGDVACPQAPAPRSTITPAQDAAMAMAAAANPALVFVAPKFEAATCSQFSSNPPHPTPAGATAWATMMADYYK